MQPNSDNLRMKKTILLFIIFSFSLVTSALAKSQWETAISEYNEYSLPLVNVEVNVSRLSKENYIPGHITIVDAEMRTEGRLMASFDCKLRYRGASSLKYEKKSFAINIIDNNVKNTHFSCPDINVNETYLITPWDLDCSLGGLYEGSHYEEYTKISELTSNYIYYQLYVYNVDNFRESMKERWQELSLGIMSPNSFNSRLDAYAKRFKESGAWQREYDKWNNNPVPLDLDEELEYVKKWYVNNIAALNKVLGVIADDIPYVFQDTDSYNIRMYNIDGKRIMSNPTGRRIYIENGRKIIR